MACEGKKALDQRPGALGRLPGPVDQPVGACIDLAILSGRTETVDLLDHIRAR